MIQRLEDIEAGKLKAEEVDLYFYSHELTESDLMQDYLDMLEKAKVDFDDDIKFERAYARSHAETCKIFDIKADLKEPEHFYTKEALKASENLWKTN